MNVSGHRRRVHNLKLCPIVLDILAMISVERRMGPLIIDEPAGQPNAEHECLCTRMAYDREFGAGDGNRTHDIQLGKLSFYH
jgi:hypothetical protein